MNDHSRHNHDSPEAAFACDMVQAIHGRAGQAAGVVILRDEDGRSQPCAALIGNMTDLANMVAGMIDAAVASGRPTDCIACMSNFDALLRAREVMSRIIGSC